VQQVVETTNDTGNPEAQVGDTPLAPLTDPDVEDKANAKKAEKEQAVYRQAVAAVKNVSRLEQANVVLQEGKDAAEAAAAAATAAAAAATATLREEKKAAAAATATLREEKKAADARIAALEAALAAKDVEAETMDVVDGHEDKARQLEAELAFERAGKIDFRQLCGSTCEVVLESGLPARAVLVGSSTAEDRVGDTLPVFVFRSEDHVVPVCSRWKRGGTTKPDNREGDLAKLQREGIEPCATTKGKECAGCQRTFAVYVGNQESLHATVIEPVIGPVPAIAKGNMPSPINLSWVVEAPKLGFDELMSYDLAEEGGGTASMASSGSMGTFDMDAVVVCNVRSRYH
jgi:hypothetical protein